MVEMISMNKLFLSNFNKKIQFESGYSEKINKYVHFSKQRSLISKGKCKDGSRILYRMDFELR